ncbi:solute carrier organic anion transporter family member 2B1-like isoform X2 [Zootermopsis nevadensis]|uniref:solute carrier organic anion transporter family member 2B1-like isoform X2 n=1 Tax=Zootermopsis nevadensis TaxID=136037 RepID=UPI000B8E956A|nr:solute carrier organic anion transporter family member 2B1-like isoform X2 [Zootermopsis nevadensis]
MQVSGAMIRPEMPIHSSETLDVDFSIPVRLQARQLHCGLGMNGFYWEPSWIQKFATHRVFVAVLASLGFLQGAAMGYFIATVNVVANSFGFSHGLVSWIMVSNEIAQGVLGLVISFWGGRGNRPGWIATCATFQALTCFLLLLPHLVHETNPDHGHVTSTAPGESSGEPLCFTNITVPEHKSEEYCHFTMVLMFLIQLGAGLGGIAVLSHGLAYVDDNVEKGNSPALIGEIIALRHLGPHVGVLLAWRCLSLYSGPLDVEPRQTSSEWVGAWWLGWPILSTLMFVVAILVAMFPRQLPSQAVKEMAASIVDLARGVTFQAPTDPRLSNTGFFSSLRRLLTNRIIVLNTLATVCLQAAMANYLALEDKYLESKFYIPRPSEAAGGFQDPWTSRLIISLLKPPLVALHILVSGFAISKIRMRAGRLTAWHVFITLLVAIFMFSRIFTNCPSLHIEGQNNGRFQPLQTCNRHCDCSDSTLFTPVCTEQGSFLYYSPCHAGCTQVQYLDDIKSFANCSCVRDKLGNQLLHQAKGGPCNNPDCNFSWIVNQCFTVLTAALVGTRLVGNAILTFRSVQPKDKSVAVGLELTLVGLIAYVPANLVYQLMAGLMTVCALLSAAVWYFARDLDLYSGDDDDDDDDCFEMEDLNRKRNPKITSRRATPGFRRRQQNPVTSEVDGVTLRSEVERIRQPEQELGFSILELSDHMDDSMEASSPNRPQSLY